MADRIDDFITALQDEIETVKKSKAGTIDLHAGSLTTTLGQTWVYSFTAARLLNSEDETPAKLSLDGKNVDCSIVFCNGNHVQVAVGEPLGQTIAVAQLTTNRAAVLVRLVEKLRDAKSNRKIFQLADEVFAGRSRSIVKFGSRAKYTHQALNAPNLSQAEAIENSFCNSLAVIWGPPGTGKTRTIARAVEAHLEAGRRVLLVSHANAAVDAALEEIAVQLAKTYYAEGKIVRLGRPRDKRLEKRCPLVLADNVMATKSTHLVEELDQLSTQVRPLDLHLKQCQAFKQAADKVRELEKEQQRPTQIAPYQQRLQQIHADIARAEAEIAYAHSNGSAPSLKEHLNDLNIFIGGRKRFAREIEEKLAAHAASADQRELELAEANRVFDELMDATGISPNDLGGRIEKLSTQVNALDARIKELNKVIASGRQNVMSEARVVGTSLSKLFYTNALSDQSFDILILDEASMAPLPHLYYALSKVSLGVTLVGDFKQLPPIVTAETPTARKWLGDNIFDQLDINSADKARQTALVSMLDTQYRMAPEIGMVASELFYGGLLQNAPSTNDLGLHDSVFGDRRVVIIDTSQVDPWCITPPSGSRLNIYSAGLAVKIAERLLREHYDISLGVATPYRPQAEFIARVIDGDGLGERASVNTVHSFQGGECSAVIFDCVDGKGSKKSLLDDNVNGPLNGHASDHVISSARVGHLDNIRALRKSMADVILNVALTRARSLFILIVNKEYFAGEIKDSILNRFIDTLSSQALTIDARDIDESFAVRPLEEPQPTYAPSNTTYTPSNPNYAPTTYEGQLFDEKNFWNVFDRDLSTAQKKVSIVSPFLTSKRSLHFFDSFEDLTVRGVKVTVYTRPPTEHTQDFMTKEAEVVIRQLENIGVTVLLRPKIHQKVVIIDDDICWEGSLNILSHKDSLEQMRRLHGAAIASELRANLRLND
jgi:hypothetical protein